MKVYLLSLDGGRCVFYSEGPEKDAEADSAPALPRQGLRGWVERKFRSLQVILTESEKGVGLRVRRVWEWLQKRTAPDEPLLRALRGETAVELHHPPAYTREEARELWREYLKGRQGRHAFWAIINALIAPLTLVFTPLPGPNVIGYWVVYRAVCHWLARLGARNARCGAVETAFHSTGALDGAFGENDHERIASLTKSFGLHGLEAFVKRVAAERARARRKAPLAVS
ncbi:MAG TPA: hypothetical protein VN256_04600 [Pyrinomonadaceae bacterium]|nr:hypothetical protein [Pyrinomonadaceae bacterium]